jgi:hypothetical protein
MPFNRRDLLCRIPALPIALGAAMAQGPAMMQKLFSNPGVPRVITLSEETLPQRLQWFTNALTWVQRPTVAMPSDEPWRIGQLVSPQAIRAVVQWERYADRVRELADSYSIPLAEAERIVGVTLDAAKPIAEILP